MAEEEPTPIQLSDLRQGDVPPDVKPLLFTNFARENSIQRAGGQVYGNWSPSFAGACTNGFIASIPEQAIQSLNRVGSCPGGGTIVKAEHY